MGIIKKLIEERTYRKKYNALMIVYLDFMHEMKDLEDENEKLTQELLRLKKERCKCGTTRKELSNDKGSTNDSRNRVSVSKQDNERGSRPSDSKKLSTTTN